MKIKAIISTTTAARDRNGNCYHFGSVTNTANGKQVIFSSLGGESNLRHLVYDILRDWSAIDSRNETLPIREWNRSKPKGFSYDGTQGKRDVAALLGSRMCEPCEGRGLIGYGSDIKACADCNRKGYLPIRKGKGGAK